MSSTLRFYGAIPKTTKFQHLKTVSYYDSSIGATVPVPFIYSNGTLDVNIQDNVENDLIYDEDDGTIYNRFLVNSLGGFGIVTSIGPNFAAWIKNWVEDYEGGTVSNIQVYTPGVVTRVQYSTMDQNTERGEILANDIYDDTWGITTTPPTSNNYTTGDAQNNFNSVWIFKDPLTVSFVRDGTTYYLTYNSVFAPVYD